MEVLIATVGQPLRNVRDLVLPVLLRDANASFSLDREVGREGPYSAQWQSPRHLCHHQHHLQPPPKVAPDQDREGHIVTHALKHS